MLQSRLFKKDRAVQERWFRMKFHLKFGHKLKAILFWHLHRKLEREFLVTEKALNATIEITVREYRKIDETLFPASKQFFNIGLYFLLAERDIQAVKADAFAHSNETKRNIALRTLLLTVYEWDMGKVTGRHMNFIYETTNLSEASKKAVVDALKDLKKAHKIIKNQFSETRHNTIAHREPNAMRQYEIITELDVKVFAPALSDFYEMSGKLLKALVVAMTEIGLMESLFHQLIYKKKGQ